MELDPRTLLAIAGIALATYATRVAGFAFMRFMNVRGRVRAALDAVPPAILMAVIAPTILATGFAETLAAAITAVAAMFRLPLIAVVIIGVASVVALRFVIY
jgi:branched chain amino acid efflux pump